LRRGRLGPAEEEMLALLVVLVAVCGAQNYVGQYLQCKTMSASHIVGRAAQTPIPRRGSFLFCSLTARCFSGRGNAHWEHHPSACRGLVRRAQRLPSF
jgi:hypothetical protein